MAGDFLLKIKAILDSQNIEQQLKTIGERQKITFKADGSQVQQTVRTLTTANGQLVQSVDTYNSKTKQTTSTLKEMGQDMKTVTTETKTYKNSLGQTVTETSKFNKAGQQVGETTKRITTNMKEAESATKKTGQGFGDIIGKVGKFLLATTVIAGFTNGIRDAYNEVAEFNKVSTEFQKVSDLSGDSLDKYTDKLALMGEEVARNRSEMLEGATEYVKGGYSEEDAATLSRISALYQNIADSQVSAGDASSFVISQMKAFNIEASQSEHIIDSVNEVSNRYAVSSTDISGALSRTSSAMAALGNSFQETIGLTTAGTELLYGQASKVARGLKFQRLFVLDPLKHCELTGKSRNTLCTNL